MSNEEFPKGQIETLWAPWRVEYFEKQPRDMDFLSAAARASDDAEHLVVTRRKTAFLMMNRYPYSVGHLMAVPYKKTADLSSLGENEIVDLWNLVVHAQSLVARSGPRAGIQRWLKSWRMRRRRCRRPLAHSHRAALERRHEFHAGDCRN